MGQIKAIIADDEEQLVIYLESMLSRIWPELRICGRAGNGRDALSLIESESPDIAFLDIKMPGLSGMEVAARCGGSTRVVFITAFNQYAVDAFENEAMDYLLKPVTNARLEKTVARLKKQVAKNTPPAELKAVIEEVIRAVGPPAPASHLKWIKAQHRDSIRLIYVDDVLFFKSSAKYTTVLTAEGESLIKKPIKELSEELDPETFWRIHRGTIINAGCIDKISHSLTGRLAVKLKGSSEILTVSRSYSHLFKQM
ncbi:LytR/AlgR family response regulator transcription factor [Desulfoluna spongiiphila]|uniref:LytR/AlgR family response regulator transcription factor n=1 Tax=Desulfoluna spongiiphila TaxID=419481 RepID=UPI001252D8B1|nr:LytTR family DNA-binding domain-containing protein [Desulfoluna spongiiphila]VVS91637.1 signal transduction response regulator receiver domain [Desulfoluna spongiiphila]